MAKGYYGQPLLKPPVWTWEVPAYFFVGGVAGVAAVLAAVGALTDTNTALVRDARWVAAIGALISPVLLISDLGRPDRFLNMLRVFKTRSPMSVGAWTLAVFTPAVLAALIWDPASATSMAASLAGHAGSVVGAATGLVLATYTGVLIGVTAIPVWAAHVRHLPYHFGASSLGAAVGILELLGHRTSAMNALGIVAAAGLTAMRAHVELDKRPASTPLKDGSSGALTRLGDALSGPVALAMRVIWPSVPVGRMVAAVCAIIGSVVTRFGWIAAGRASVLLALATLLVLPLPRVSAEQRGTPDLSTGAIVATVAQYVDKYQEEFKFLLADEDYVQRVSGSGGVQGQERHLTGELFLTYVAGDGDWIAVHDFAEMDGKPIPGRVDVRALLQKSDTRGVAGVIANANAKYNVGALGRNINQPTLPLLLFGRKRLDPRIFDRGDVVTRDGRTVVTLEFRERERPTLVRDAKGVSLFSRGTVTVDAATGRVERTLIEIKSGTVHSRLITEYELDPRIGLWVPTVFRERYEGNLGDYHEVIQCEGRYTNYRRFEVTGRIKKE